MDALNNRQNPHLDSLPHGVQSFMVGKASRKSLDLPLSMKIVHQKSFCIGGGVAEICANIKASKDAGVMVSTYPLLTHLFGLRST